MARVNIQQIGSKRNDHWDNVLAMNTHKKLITVEVSSFWTRLLCFQHLPESRFLLGALHRRSKFAKCCPDLMKNHVVTIYAQKVLFLSFVFKKIKYYHFFPIAEMNANCAEMCRVGNLEADFQQIPYVQFFLNFHNIGVKHQ